MINAIERREVLLVMVQTRLTIRFVAWPLNAMYQAVMLEPWVIKELIAHSSDTTVFLCSLLLGRSGSNLRGGGIYNPQDAPFVRPPLGELS
jgi:hypothetical protein